jgi:hypothetical protein
MTRFVKLLPAILALPLCAQAAGPELFKYKDAAGRITYAGRECRELGLSSAGEIKDRSTLTPALKVPVAPPPVPDAADKEAAPPQPEQRRRTRDHAKQVLHGEDRQGHGRTLQ